MATTISTSGTTNLTTPTGDDTVTFSVAGSAVITCIGAGGSGANGGGTGGGGGASATLTLSVSPSATYHYSVGDGGLASEDGGGQYSWVAPTDAIDAICLAVGGGNAGPGGASGDCIGDTKRSGGNGHASGGGGSSAGTAAAGISATGSEGALAPTGGGNGGNNTVAGLQPGGGGGGDADGGAGKITIVFTANPIPITTNTPLVIVRRHGRR